MGVDAIAALIFGRWFDRIGLWSLMIAVSLSLFFAPLVFSQWVALAGVGMVLWGIGMGAQESIMKAAVAGIVPAQRRGSAFGIFNTGYGLAWFAGSVVMGWLYDTSLPVLIGFSVLLQGFAVAGLWWVWRVGAMARG
jgi:predicted MFS family arabinose efflux permease